jgi:cytoskeletal protein CcmA (bactofilin family)
MIKMGRGSRPEQGSSDHTTDQQETRPSTLYPSSSYQSTEAQHRQQASTTDSSSIHAMSESESLARDIKEGVLSGYVGNGTMLTGEATFKAMLRVDGHLSGSVSSEAGTLIVGNNGQVDADVNVSIATIHGTVNGDIIASQRLELGRAAKVNGNIQTPSLVIEQGAIFEGSCRMVQLKEEQEKAREVMLRGSAASAGASAGAGSSTSTSTNTNTAGSILDTSSMKPVRDESAETSDYSDISDVAS